VSKKLIYTTFKPNKDYEEYNSLLSEWIISLRTLGNYKDEVVVFNYSHENLYNYLPSKNKLGNFKVVQLDPDINPAFVSNRRNVDVIVDLCKYSNYSISHFDADVWFQKDINPMFDIVESTEGMCFAIERGRSCNFREGSEEYLQLFKDNQQKLNGFVFGGWFAGNYKAYIKHLRRMKLMFDEGKWDICMHGADQSMLNVLVDFDKDNFSGLKWAASQYFCEFDNGSWKLDGEDVHGFHLIAYGRARSNSMEKLDENYRFKNLHKNIYDEFMKI